MKRTLLLGTLAVLAWVPVSAQDAADDFAALAAAPAGDETAPAADFGTLKWSGENNFVYRWGAYDPATRTGGLVDGKVAAEYKAGDLKLTGAALARNGEFVPGETLVSWNPGAFKFSAGLAEFSWGVADANNPTDTLNARDYRFGATADRLVNPAVTAAWYPADWLSVEAVYEPWKDPSKFPKDFQASTQAGLDSGKTALSDAGYNAVLGSYHPKATLVEVAHDGSEPVYGGRINFYLPGVDLAASYVYDRDTYLTPVVTMKHYTAVWVPETVELTYKRVQRAGLNAKTTLDRFGLWFEGAYNLTEDPDGSNVGIRDNKFTWTTGVDFNFGPASAYYVNLQYAGSWIPGYDAATASDYGSPSAANLNDEGYMTRRTYRSLVQSLGAESEEWLHGLTYSLKFPISDLGLTPTLSGAVLVPVNYDRTAADGTVRDRIASAFFKPELELAPADGVKLLVGADLAYGYIKKDGSSDIGLDTTTDKLGTYTPQNSVYVKLNYQWNGSLSGN